MYQPAITFVIAIGPSSTKALTTSGVARSFRAAFGAALDCAPEVVFIAAVRDTRTGLVTLFAAEAAPNVEGNTQVSADVQDALLLGDTTVSSAFTTQVSNSPSAFAHARLLQNALSDAAPILPTAATNASGVVVAFVVLAPVAKGSDSTAGASQMAVKMRGLISDAASLSAALAPGLSTLAAAQGLPASAMHAGPAPGNSTVTVTQVARVRIVYSFTSYLLSLNKFLGNAVTIGVSIGVSVFVLLAIAGAILLRKSVKVSPQIDTLAAASVIAPLGVDVAPEEASPVRVVVSERQAVSTDSEADSPRPFVSASSQSKTARLQISTHSVEMKGPARSDSPEPGLGSNWHAEDPGAANEENSVARGNGLSDTLGEDAVYSRRRRAAQLARRKTRGAFTSRAPLPGVTNEDSDEALVLRAEANAADARHLAEGARLLSTGARAATLRLTGGAALGPRPMINASAALRGAGALALLSEQRNAGLNLLHDDANVTVK